MEINLFAYAPPFFLVLIVIEYIISRYQQYKLYSLDDFTNNISTGIIEQSGSLPLQGLLILSYQYLYQNHALFLINYKSPYTWILLWIGVDFFYYWFHRACHRNTFLWTGHSVHHQSEKYNLSVALRQGLLQAMCAWVVYLPLAIIGFPTWMYLTVFAANTFYQFWLHTQLIDRLGWFEIIFNTPSHHRVHHGINEQYIDKNFGGSLIIWDKLFGTFIEEGAPVNYGVTEPLLSWNPFFANVKVIYDTYFYSNSLSLGKRILAFLKPPEWIKDQLKQSEFVKLMAKHRKKLHLSALKIPVFYVLCNLIYCFIAFNFFLFYFSLDTPKSWLIGVFLLITLYMLGDTLNNGLKTLSIKSIKQFLSAHYVINLIFNIEFVRLILLMAILLLYSHNYYVSFFICLLFLTLNCFLKSPSVNKYSLGEQLKA